MVAPERVQEPSDTVDNLTALLCVVAMAGLSGFFALTNYALRAFRWADLERAFGLHGPGETQSRSRAGRRLARLENHLKPLRLTASFSRAAANVVLVVAMLALFRAADGGLGRAVGAVLSAMSVIAVFGVAIPHAWACYAGEKILAATLGVLVAWRYALYPVVTIMHFFDVPMRRLVGFPETGGPDNVGKKEILQTVAEGRAEGTIEEEEVRMMESVMEFRETRAGAFMTPRTDIFALPADMNSSEALRGVSATGHTRAPVYEGDLDNIIGILYTKDLLQQLDADEDPGLREVMRPAFFVPETKSLDKLLRDFKARKVRMAVVCDEHGGTAGLITAGDLLEKIVGDIADEYDRPEPQPARWINDSVVEVAGRLRIDELNDMMALEIPEQEDCQTVAGLLLSGFGYVPSEGECLEACGAGFTVLAANERRIGRVRVERLRKHEDSVDHD